MVRWLLGLIVLAGTTQMAGQAARPGVGRHQLPTGKKSIAFVLGYEDDFGLPPSKIDIYTSGRVRIVGRRLSARTVARVHLSPSSVLGILRVAEAESFFAVPSDVGAATPTPDVPARYISIRTRGGRTKTVVEQPTDSPDAAVREFDRLFLIIESAAGIVE